MNYFRVQSAVTMGPQAIPIQVECAQSRRLPYLQILGGSASSAAEMRERVLAALDSGKWRLPARKITVQLQPNVQGLPISQLDLAVAVAILGSCGQIPPQRCADLLFWGELGLDGSLRNPGHSTALRCILKNARCVSAILPWEASEFLTEEQVQQGGGFQNLGEVVDFLRNPQKTGTKIIREEENEAPSPHLIWKRLEKEAVAQRALEISAAGAHHLFFSGPSSANPELFAHALSLLLPPLRESEAEEVNAVYELAGMKYLSPSRPFLVSSHSRQLPPLFSEQRLSKVEELLLAHRGIFYVDQICERESALFPDLLAPMLRGKIPVRVGSRRMEMPAESIVVAASALCACGGKGHSFLSCTCRPTQARRFEEKWRRILQYPFDLHLSLPAERSEAPVTSWAQRAQNVEEAQALAKSRQGKCNARLSENELWAAKPWGESAKRFWNVMELRLGPRAQALARVALTISDLRKSSQVQEIDLFEARHYFPEGAAEVFGETKRSSRSSPPELNSIAVP